MAACTPSIHVFLGRPLFLLSRGIQSIINFGILSSCWALYLLKSNCHNFSHIYFIFFGV